MGKSHALSLTGLIHVLEKEEAFSRRSQSRDIDVLFVSAFGCFSAFVAPRTRSSGHSIANSKRWLRASACDPVVASASPGLGLATNCMPIFGLRTVIQTVCNGPPAV